MVFIFDDLSIAVNYEADGQGTKLNYRVLSKAVSEVRACKKASAVDAFCKCEDWAEEIRTDYKKRHKTPVK